MSYSKGIISATDPVTMTDIKRALGVYNYSDIGGLIMEGARLGRINKWNKHKPIRYANKLTKLTESEFIGQSSDTSDGIYYGIRFNATASNIVDIHNASFEYVYPTGTVEAPFRMGDFAGYNINAKPDLYGDIEPNNGVFFKDTDVAVTLSITHAASDYGIPFTDILNRMTGGQLSDVMALCYPCILVGNYARAMKASSGNPEPLGAATTKNYTIGLQDCPENLAIGQKVSFFLYPKTNGDVMFSLTSWNHCLDTVFANRALPLPDITGINATFISTPAQGLTIGIGNVTAFGQNMTINYTPSSDSDEYDVRCVVAYGTEEVVKVVQNGMSIANAIILQRDEFTNALLVANTPYTFTVTMSTAKHGTTAWTNSVSKTVTVTFTA